MTLGWILLLKSQDPGPGSTTLTQPVSSLVSIKEKFEQTSCKGAKQREKNRKREKKERNREKNP